MISHNLGFPRIGKKRELKFALESFWQGQISQDQFLSQAKALRQQHWQSQQALGIDLVPVGDFAHYDHVLSTSLMLGIIPTRIDKRLSPLDVEFAIARGTDHQSCSCAASDMTKWFDTNYHYIVPEISETTVLNVNTAELIEQITEVKNDGLNSKPVIIGPLTYLYLAQTSLSNKLDFLPQLLSAYQQILDDIDAQGCEWIQIDEPILALELSQPWLDAFVETYKKLTKRDSKWLLTTYFGSINHVLTTIIELNIDGIHIDTVSEPTKLSALVKQLPKQWVISLGVIDGRNIWKADLVSIYQELAPIYDAVSDRLWIAPSCSLLHCPIDLSLEQKLDPEIKSWLAFANEKCQEIALLQQALITKNTDDITVYSTPVLKSLVSNKRTQTAVTDKLNALTINDFRRSGSYETRKAQQQRVLNLPLFPTTTIGSFPQTPEIRTTRALWKKGQLSEAEYQQRIKAEISAVIAKQESIGLDVLVHGEAERNDMVEYFGELLDGIAITECAWVQSYGSRCVKPPVIYGDVSRQQPLTVPWIVYANSLSTKPVKAMLTGPITCMSWSFIRNDIPREQVAQQLALAIKEEVTALVEHHITIIQIDEPAIKEAMPLKDSQKTRYSEWATAAFRLCSSHVDEAVQIHSHICYSEFNDILSSLIDLDADVLTIETSRSHMEILSAFEHTPYPYDLGPGVYDIHSPNVPSIDWIKALIGKAIDFVPKERLWINPDCGLKTRRWSEVEPALKNLVQAAQSLRAQG